MEIKKKHFQINTGFLFFVLLVIQISCSNDYPLEKLSLPAENNRSKTFLKYDNLKSPDPNQDYFYFKDYGTTYRGRYISIQDKYRLRLDPALRGKINLYLNIKKLSHVDNPLDLKIFKKTTTDDILIFQIKNFYKSITINREIKLDRSEELYLEFSGNGDILLTTPLVHIKGKNRQKNFVFLICADTLRADYLNVYGCPESTSMNITDFSRDAVVFENCFSQSPWTLPSHMSLFTGLDVFNHGVYNKKQKISRKVKILSEILDKKYFNISYNGNLFVGYKYGFYRGFDFYSSQVWDWNEFLDPRRSPETARKIFLRMVRFLKDVGSPKVFSFLHTYQVHSPYRLHPGLPYSDSLNINSHSRFFSVPQDLGPAGGHQYIFRMLKSPAREKIINLYNSEIEFFDHWFGYFINKLKEMGVYERSLIVLLSDHGEEFFDHKGWGHGHSLYNELIRVPLIIKFPNQRFKGKRVFANVALIDVFPTIFDILGIVNNIKIDGRSLLPVIKDSKGKERGNRKIYSILKYVGKMKKYKLFSQKVSVITRNFKLIHNFKYTEELKNFYSEFPPPPYQEYELYDLDADALERKNLILEPKHKVVFEKLKREIMGIIRAIYKSREKGIPIELTEEDFKKLKTLGYM